MKNKIKLVIFDAYGVLLTGGYPDTCKFLAKKFRRDWKEIYRIIYVKYFNRAAEKHITQQAAWAGAIRELGLPITVPGIKKIHYGLMGMNNRTVVLAKKMREQFKILLLSKNTRGQFADINKMFPVIHRVFGKNIVNTWEYDLPKASRETVFFVCDRYHVRPAEIAYVDDQKENLEIARSMGVNVVLYQNFDQVKTDLEKMINGV